MSGEQSPQPTIAELNDAFRRTTRRIVITPGVGEFDDLLALIMAVRTFDDFNEDNDPHLEHDFGALDWHDERTYWKIEYFNKELTAWEDPLSPECERIMTVGLLSEY